MKGTALPCLSYLGGLIPLQRESPGAKLACMAPLVVVVVMFTACFALGQLGVVALGHWQTCLRVAMAAMFLFTSAAHFNAMRADLIQMVPPGFPRPELMVTITGFLEIAGAIGLLYPPTVKLAAIGLAFLMLMMFPANVSAARRNLPCAGSR